MRPRVGHIQFLNCLPLYYGLIKNKVLFDMELVKGIPTELNQMLLNRTLDVSPISTIEYCLHADKLLLLPELTVSSDGEVKSILLISKYPIKKLNRKKVALTKSSATSRILTKVILKEKYNFELEYTDNKSTLKETLNEADAALLIGDDALHALYRTEGLYIYDLGKEWKELTGKKMVYAVWAVRREFAETKPELLQEIFSCFISSMEYSSGRLREIACACARWEEFDDVFLYAYFKSLRFEFGKDYQEGMLQFFNHAKEHGFVDIVPELEFASLNVPVTYKKENKETIFNLLPDKILPSSGLYPEVMNSLINKGLKDLNDVLRFLTPPGLFNK
ncbi:MAG: menaquinone biosynthesis protein [Candidatus Firestonebacteria bacterium]|nr:menaquinone biosynthesis protein [Candidatus Firestonebacteria bacterium]